MTINPEDLELVELTDKELIDYTRKENSVAWKGVLSNDQYVLREYVLGKSEMTKVLHVYMLKDRNNSDTMISSIELLVRPGFIFEKKNDDVIKTEVKSGCVGGVFTYPNYRGKGYGRIMIDKLKDLAINKILGEDGFIFLYSEIGEFYAPHGFKSFDVPLINLDIKPVGNNMNFNEPLTNDRNEEIQLIKYHKFEDLLKSYKLQAEEMIVLGVNCDGKPRVTIDINSHIIDWFHLRAKFISLHCFHKDHTIDFNLNYKEISACLNDIDPHHFGLKLVKDNKLIGYIIWTYDWNNEADDDYSCYATVINIFVDTNYDREFYTKELINLLQKYLNHLNQNKTYRSLDNIKKIVLWTSEVNSSVRETLLKSGGSIVKNGSRSAILMNNQRYDDMLAKGGLIWEVNNKLPWF